MNPTPSEPTPPTVEQGINSLLHETKDQLASRYEKCEACVRASPGKAMMIAFGAGYLAHRLPIRALLITNVRILSALVPPAMVAFGAAKLCEVLQNQARK